MDEKKINPEETKVEQVVKTPAKVKTKGKFAKFLETFVEEDLKSVLSWAAKDVLVPALKKMFVEFVNNTASSMVYGHSTNTPRSSTNNVSYREYWERPRSGYEPARMSSRTNDIYSYGTVEVSTKEEAQNVLDAMDDYLSMYPFITVGVFMEMVGLQPRHTDFNYGWSSLRSAEIVHSRTGGWVIKLPKVMPIDR